MYMFLLYKTTNLINGKYYIGIHRTTNLNDGYLGSGTLLKQSIKKYGKSNFKREILSMADDYESLINLEREIVNEDFIKRRDTYNMEIGGSGGKVWTDELKQKVSKSKQGSIPWNKDKSVGSFFSKETLKKMSNNMRGENNPMHGKSVSDFMTVEDNALRLKRISEANTGKVRTKKHKENYSKAASQRIWLVNKDGIISHTINPNDVRLSDPNWRRGKKWKK